MCKSVVCFLLMMLIPSLAMADDSLRSALKRAGENREQLQIALDEIPAAYRTGMEFLIRHMPEQDLATLKSDFLLKNVKLAYKAWETSNWKDQVPEDVFLNDVLPYASITESREDWRSDFYQRFSDLVKDAQTPGEAAVILNNNIFKDLGVKYSTKRKRADQSPSESIEQGLASCSGLSVILIDACRAVGVPARFVGTPLWSNKSGNHSWVEIYDRGWQFTGAAEATGNELNKGWFVNQASKAIRDDRYHAVYATSYRKTPINFPMVWAPGVDFVYAVNVTDRYTRLKEKLPEGFDRVMFVAKRHESDERIRMTLVITDANGKEQFRGRTNDDSFDSNDHVSVPLKIGETYDVRFGEKATQKIKAIGNDQLVVFRTTNQPNDGSGDQR